jgi:hypothetical protein
VLTSTSTLWENALYPVRAPTPVSDVEPRLRGFPDSVRSSKYIFRVARKIFIDASEFVMANRAPIVRMHIVAQILLAQSLSATAAHSSCAEVRTQLGSAVAVVASLEAQLVEARRTMIAKKLEVGLCEMSTTTKSQLGTSLSCPQVSGPCVPLIPDSSHPMVRRGARACLYHTKTTGVSHSVQR